MDQGAQLIKIGKDRVGGQRQNGNQTNSQNKQKQVATGLATGQVE